MRLSIKDDYLSSATMYREGTVIDLPLPNPKYESFRRQSHQFIFEKQHEVNESFFVIPQA